MDDAGIPKERFDALTKGAPVYDMGDPAQRRSEAEAVVENILGSMIGMLEAHIKKPEKKKRPSPEGYAKILLGDLKARGFELREIER